MEIINFILEFLNNRWVNAIFLFLAAGSIIVNVILYLKSRKRKIPTYLMKTFNLFKDKVASIEKIKITYSEHPIENLSITKIAIWNRGNEVINFSDLAPMSPLEVKTVNDNKILDAKIIHKQNENNNFSIKISDDQKSVRINFDYFYKNEGVVLEVYHNGTSGKDILLGGSLKEVPKLFSAHFDEDFLLEWVIDNSFGLLEKHLSGIPLVIYIILVIIILMPLYIPVMPFLKTYSIFKKLTIPKEFSLTNEE